MQQRRKIPNTKDISLSAKICNGRQLYYEKLENLEGMTNLYLKFTIIVMQLKNVDKILINYIS